MSRAQIAAGVLICASLGMPPISARAADFPQSFAPLVDRVKPAVVNISTTATPPARDRRMGQEGQGLPPGFEEFFRHFGGPNSPFGGGGSTPHKALGSGFIVDPSGFVVTNNHVVADASDIKVTLQDGTTLKAKVIGTDEKTDLAVLKIEAGHPLPAVSFGDSDKARVGDWVVSVGNPFGLGGTVTAGIVSASGRDVNGPYDDFLQIDAPINPGNSGGPTFDENGDVIGINTAIVSSTGGSVGIGFAIASNIAKPIVMDLEKNGSVKRGWLGVQMQAITPDMEEALGLHSTNGVVVANVVPDGPAAKAGIKTGDVITAFNDRPVKAMRDLARDVADTPAGQKADIHLLREGKAQTIAVSIDALKDGKAGAEVGSADTNDGLGLELGALDQRTRQQFDLPQGISGAVVTGIKPDSPAAGQGIHEGDVIVRVDNVQIQSPSDAADAVKKARDAGKKAVAVLINRGGQNQFVAVPLDKDAG